MKNAYVLEGKLEFDRLEYQSTLPEYDYKKELATFIIPPGGTCLDAGCGSGIATRYLAERFPESKIIGCDSSSDRIEKAQEVLILKKHLNLFFKQDDLSNLSFGDNSFDSIVCRYVLQHIPPTKIGQVFRELNRCLKPGGNIIFIDADGIFSNLHPISKELSSQLFQIEKNCSLDFSVGRKISSYMSSAGFHDLQQRAEAILFTGASLERELSLMRLRFNAALPSITTALGSEFSACEFIKNYLKALQVVGSTYFHTMFTVQGTKAHNV